MKARAELQEMTATAEQQETAAAPEPQEKTSADHDRVRFRPRGRIIRAEDVHAWDTGEAYLEAARDQAARIEQQARDAFERQKRRGFEEGRKEGAEAAATLLAETAGKADRFLAEADGQVVDLAIAVVQRVLGDCDVRQLTLDAVRHALAKQRQDQHLTLYVAPDLADDLRLDVASKFEEGLRHLITVEADPRLDADQCRLASGVGFVELGVEAQIRALHQGLRDGLKRSARDSGQGEP